MTLDELQKLVDAATPGEWDATHISSGYEAITVMDMATGKHTQITHTITVADAAFIIAARTYLPKLLEVARAAKEYTFWLEARDRRLSEPFPHEGMIEEACRCCDDAGSTYRETLAALES